MIIIGAKGLAKEILEVCKENKIHNDVVFFDNVNLDTDKLFNNFQILHDESSLIKYFKEVDNKYVLGLGDIGARKLLAQHFLGLGGIFTTLISPRATVGSSDVTIGKGVVILPGAVISNSVSISEGCLIYFNACVTHDVSIGAYSIISPGVTILGRTKIGEECFIGANATILPDIAIGNNVTVGAGAVVTKHIPDNSRVVGIPAKNL